MKYFCLLLWGIFLGFSPLAGAEGSLLHENNPQTNTAYVLSIDGAIGPAISDYVIAGLKDATNKNAEVVILKIDTPGGLDTSMRAIIKAILSSPVPVVAYVAPEGARAASAGTYILYAAHIAAMAPATNLGAATPVSMDGMPGNEPAQEPSTSKDKNAKDKPSNAESLRAKAIEDASAYIRGLAEKRGRNAKWAEQAVTEAKSLSAEEALKKNVINFIALDTSSLLEKINGQQVEVAGVTKTLSTKNIPWEEIQPSWQNRFFQALSNPNFAYILLMIGIYGIIFELMNPGSIVPGVLGAIALLLALYALHLLPINYAGLALLALGVVLMIAEVFVPSFGALGLGGVGAFILGSFMLLDTKRFPGFAIAKPLIFSIALVSGIFFIGVIGMALKARRRQVVSGGEEMIGAIGRVIQAQENHSTALIHGESWQVKSTTPLQKGQAVKVLSRTGLMLQVEACNKNP